jgi:hypothetical protein
MEPFKPCLPGQSIARPKREILMTSKYRTFEEVDSLNNEARKRTESKKPIVGEADISRAQTQRTAEDENNRKTVSKSAEPQTTLTSPSNNSRYAASEEEGSQEREEEESQESIVSHDEEPTDDKIIPRQVR